jgi:hypothetical protein
MVLFHSASAWLKPVFGSTALISMSRVPSVTKLKNASPPPTPPHSAVLSSS